MTQKAQSPTTRLSINCNKQPRDRGDIEIHFLCRNTNTTQHNMRCLSGEAPTGSEVKVFFLILKTIRHRQIKYLCAKRWVLEKQGFQGFAQIQRQAKELFSVLLASPYVTRSCLPCFQNVRDLSAEARPLTEHPPKKNNKKSPRHIIKRVWYFNFLFADETQLLGKRTRADMKGKCLLAIACSKRNETKRAPRCPLGCHRGGATLPVFGLKKLGLSARGFALHVGVRGEFGVGVNRSVRRAAAESSCQSLTSKLAAFTFHLRSPETAWPEWSYRNVLSWPATGSF